MRVGHSRPIGTTTRIRLYGADEEPTLGAFVYDSPLELRRGYLIVGVEEVGRPGRWNLVLERVAWETLTGATGSILYGLVRHKT